MGPHLADVRLNNKESYLHLHRWTENNCFMHSDKISLLVGVGPEYNFAIEPSFMIQGHDQQILMNDPESDWAFTFDLNS